MGFLGVVAGVVALSMGSSFAQTDCNLQPQMNNHGVNLVQSTAASAEDCCSQCSDEDGCVGFTWVSGNQDCYLKSSVDPATPDPAVTSGSITGPPPPPGPCTMYPGQNNHGNNMQSSSSTTPDACCAQCVALSGCIGWTFVPGNNDCYLKNKLDPMTPDPEVVSGSVGSPGPSCNLQPGVNSMGVIAAPPTPAASASDCCSACGNATDVHCVGFTFVEATSLCFLKNATGAPVADPGVTSGSPPSPCTTSAGVNSMGNISSFAPLASPDACCGACMAANANASAVPCAGWTYVAATQLCFLKSSVGVPVPDAGVVSGAPPSPCALQQGQNNMGTIMAPPTQLAGPGACCGACLAADGCKGFTFVTATSNCFLKSALGTPVADPGAVSGTAPPPHMRDARRAAACSRPA